MEKKISCKKLYRKVGAWAKPTTIIMGVCFCLLFILGLAMFIVGAVAVSGIKLLDTLEITGFRALMWTALFLGLFLSIVAVLGAIGYFALHKTLLIITVGFIALLAVVQIVCGGVAYSYSNYTEVVNKGWEAADDKSRAYLEKEYNCCGGMNSTHLPASDRCVGSSSSDESLAAPSSAAPPQPTPQSSSSPAALLAKHSSESSAPADGCVAILAKIAEDDIPYIGAGLITITVLEIAVIVVTLILVCKINKASQYFQVHDENDLDDLHN